MTHNGKTLYDEEFEQVRREYYAVCDELAKAVYAHNKAVDMFNLEQQNVKALQEKLQTASQNFSETSRIYGEAFQTDDFAKERRNFVDAAIRFSLAMYDFDEAQKYIVELQNTLQETVAMATNEVGQRHASLIPHYVELLQKYGL